MVVYSEVVQLILNGEIFFVLLFIFSAIAFVYSLCQLFVGLSKRFSGLISDKYTQTGNQFYGFLLSFERFMRKNNLFESFLAIVLLFAFFAFFWFEGFLDGYRDSNLSTTLLPKITMLSSSITSIG